MRVIFSKIADLTYNENLEFVARLWTQKEVDVFVNDAEAVVQNLKNGNFKIYKIETKNIRSVLIGKKHVKMYFRQESKDLIRVILFFEMRQDPQKIINLLK